jgi:hypothetical protein
VQTFSHLAVIFWDNFLPNRRNFAQSGQLYQTSVKKDLHKYIHTCIGLLGTGAPGCFPPSLSSSLFVCLSYILMLLSVCPFFFIYAVVCGTGQYLKPTLARTRSDAIAGMQGLLTCCTTNVCWGQCYYHSFRRISHVYGKKAGVFF